MFEAGDRVVCVDDGPADPFTRLGNRTDWTIPVVKGRVYTVRAVLPKHYVKGNPGYPMLSIDAGGLQVDERHHPRPLHGQWNHRRSRPATGPEVHRHRD